MYGYIPIRPGVGSWRNAVAAVAGTIVVGVWGLDMTMLQAGLITALSLMVQVFMPFALKTTFIPITLAQVERLRESFLAAERDYQQNNGTPEA